MNCQNVAPLVFDAMARRQKRDRRVALGVTVGLHLLLLFVFALVTVFPALVQEAEIRAVVVAPSVETVPRIRREEAVRMAANLAAPPAAAMAQIIQASAPAPIALPSALAPDLNAPIGLGAASGLGVSRGAFGGLGTGVSASSFFGQQSQARRVAYVVDYSGSMRGNPDRILRQELSRSLQQMPAGVQFAVILFSGPTWVLGEDPQPLQDTWNKGQGGVAWTPKDGKLPVATWIPASAASLRKAAEQAVATPLTYGTDWLNPLQVALSMNPPPEVIYFMTDGAPQAGNVPEVISMVKRLRRQTVINVIGIQVNPSLEANLAWLASVGGGQFTIVREADGSVEAKNLRDYDIRALEKQHAARLK